MAKAKKKRLEIYVDGSATYDLPDLPKRGNNARISCAFVVYEKGKVIDQGFIPIPYKGSVNQAEFIGVLYGLRAAKALGGTHIQMFSDSTIVVNAINRASQNCSIIGSQEWIAAINVCRTGCFQKCSLTWIPREKNFADAILREGLGMKPDKKMEQRLADREKKQARKQLREAKNLAVSD